MIVSIGLDHMDRLGDTREKIAAEKAGIIKPGCLVINGEQDDGPRQVIEQVAKQQGAPLFSVIVPDHFETCPIRFCYQQIPITLRSMAHYQVHNACCAMATLLQLSQRGILAISEEELRRGLKKSEWKGRFQVLQRDPLMIVDGAHNEHGVRALIDSMGELPRPLILVFAALRDKDLTFMMKALHARVDLMIGTTFDFYRAADLLRIAEEPGLVLESDWHQAICRAQQAAGKEGTVLVTGSLYFISEVVAAYQNVK